MTTITANVLAPAQELGAFFEGIDLGQEPVGELLPTGLSITFSNGVSALVGLTIGATGITVGSAQVFDPDGAAIVDVPEIGLVIDGEFNPVNLDEFDTVEVVFQDFDDVADADLALGGLERLLGLDLGIPIPEIDVALRVDFGGGTDTVVFDAPRSALTERVNADGSVLVTFGEDEVTALNLERIELSDGFYVYDLAGENLGYTYRLYDAAFARTPDEAGLRFWSGLVERGELPVGDLAEYFVEAPEFDEKFGADLDDAGFVNALYNNVLRRDADPDGLAFWVSVFASGELTRADMLEDFADSTENVERNADNIDDGVWLTA